MAKYPSEFSGWLTNKLDNERLGVRDAARLIGVSHPTVIDILNGKTPSFDVCTKIARAFGLPPETVFRAAGLLPPVSGEDFTDWLHMLEQLPQDERDRLYAIGRLWMDEQQKKKDTGPLRPLEGRA